MTINSKEECKFVNALSALQSRYNYWLGASDVEKEGAWKWVTNEAFDYTFWGDGQPDNSQMNTGRTENYLQACYDWGMRWNDSDVEQDYSANAGFICEWDYTKAEDAIEEQIKVVNDEDLKGSVYELLQAKITKTTKSALKLQWKKMTAADGYMIYGNKCGKSNKYKYITTITDQNITSYTAKNLKKGTYYKYFVVAYKNQRNDKSIVTISKTIHSITKNGKYGNAKSVSITKLGKSKKNTRKVKIAVGKTVKIVGKSIKKDKKIRNHRGLAYESSNETVATVSTKGVITAKNVGTCKIYVYAQNGVAKVITVTVR